MCQFSGKTDNFHFFGPNLSKNEFWGWNFKNLWIQKKFGLGISTSKTPFFSAIFGEIAQLRAIVRYFSSNDVERAM